MEYAVIISLYLSLYLYIIYTYKYIYVLGPRAHAPLPGGGWFPSLSVARAVGFLTEWLLSFWNGLGSHCGAVLALPELPRTSQ